MLKQYVRTLENKVVKVDGTHYYYDVKSNLVFIANPFNSVKDILDIPIGHVIYQSDKIEDLCDTFIYSYKEVCYFDTDYSIFTTSTNQVFHRLSLAKEYKEYKCKGTIYGGIWTDRGLIYIAKLNEKGELELL